jgi:hypothetical protein
VPAPRRELIVWAQDENGAVEEFSVDGAALYVTSSLGSDTTRLQLVSTQDGSQAREHCKGLPAWQGWGKVVCVYMCVYMCVCVCAWVCECVFIVPPWQRHPSSHPDRRPRPVHALAAALYSTPLHSMRRLSPCPSLPIHLHVP